MKPQHDEELDKITFEEFINRMDSSVFSFVRVKVNYQDGLITYVCNSHKEYIQLYAYLRKLIVLDNVVLSAKVYKQHSDKSYSETDILKIIKSVYTIIPN